LSKTGTKAKEGFKKLGASLSSGLSKLSSKFKFKRGGGVSNLNKTRKVLHHKEMQIFDSIRKFQNVGTTEKKQELRNVLK